MRAMGVALIALAAFWFVVAFGTLAWPAFGQLVPTLVYWPLTVALFAIVSVNFLIAVWRVLLSALDASALVAMTRLIAIGLAAVVLGYQVFVTFLSPMYMGGVGYPAMALVALHEGSLAASACALGIAFTRWRNSFWALTLSVLGCAIALIVVWTAFYSAYNLLRGGNVGMPY